MFFRILFIICTFSFNAFAQPQNEFWRGPFFWDTKPEIKSRMIKEKYVPVSVTSSDENGSLVWWMKGAGVVKAPLDFTYKYASDFSQLEKQKDHFDKVKWNKKKKELELTMTSFSKKVKLKVRFWESLGAKPAKGDKTEQTRYLHFKLLEGPFMPGEGAFIFNATQQEYTEVALIARHEGDLMIFGSSLVSVAIEGVLQHMADSLRLAVEDAWQKKQAKVNSRGL